MKVYGIRVIPPQAPTVAFLVCAEKHQQAVLGGGLHLRFFVGEEEVQHIVVGHGMSYTLSIEETRTL
jgi:hypothetical protein